MEDSSERERVTSATVREDSTDATLALLFGSTLQAATLRTVIYLAILSAIVATIARLV
jgi:hypothetical protein